MRKKTKKGTSRHKKLNCIDCGVLIDSELSAHIEMSKKGPWYAQYVGVL